MDDEKVIIEDSVAPDDGTFKKRKTWIKIAIGAVAVLVFGFATSYFLHATGIINPYEEDYVDVTGKTAEDIAREKGMSFDSFLKSYGLPEDMPKSTSERAVFYNIPVGILVKKSTNIGTFEQLKEDMGWGDEITPETTIGDALDITPLSKYVGDEQLERFKSLYELADDVTGETLYGEVRNIVDSKEKEFREAGNAETE